MLRTTLGALCAIWLLACTTTPATDDSDADPGPQDGGVIREVVAYSGGGVFDDNGVSGVVVGPPVADLVAGKSYELRMVATSQMEGGLVVYQLISYRPEIQLIGSPTANGDDVSFQTINGNPWVLTGSAATTLLTTERFEPPTYEPSQMTMQVTALAEEGDARARVLKWSLVPNYECTLESVPLVKISLSNITANHALDISELMTYLVDSQIGSGTCLEGSDGYSCQMVSWGSVTEVWMFSPPTAEQTSFEITAVREGTNAERGFECVVTQRSELQAQSQD